MHALVTACPHGACHWRTCWNARAWSCMGSLPPSSALSLHVHALLLEYTTLSLSLYISLCCNGYDGRKLNGARSHTHTHTCTFEHAHAHAHIHHTRTFHHIPLHPHAQTPTTRTLTPNYTAAPDFNRRHVPPRTNDRSTCGSRSHARSVHHAHCSWPGCGCQGIRVGSGGRGCGRCRPRWSRGALRHSQEH
jgi:hypothetical protein